jgi:predicted GNAT family N-acyltransferase
VEAFVSLDVRVRLAGSLADWIGAVAVRIAVFVHEQGVPLDAELDEADRTAVHAVAIRTEPTDATAENDGGEEPTETDPHWLALARAHLPPALSSQASASPRGQIHPYHLSGTSSVVGTARLLFPAAATARIGRVAVLPAWRGRGTGSRLIQRLEEEALARGAGTVVLHAQVQLEQFYARRGYRSAGDRRHFEEDGILHLQMIKRLPIVED